MEDAESIHASNLKEMCRTCGRRNCQKDWGEALTYASEIKSAFRGSVNIKNDDINTHPPRICAACKTRLTWYRRSRGRLDYVFPELCKFTPHGPNCKVCFSGRDSPTDIPSWKRFIPTGNRVAKRQKLDANTNREKLSSDVDMKQHVNEEEPSPQSSTFRESSNQTDSHSEQSSSKNGGRLPDCTIDHLNRKSAVLEKEQASEEGLAVEADKDPSTKKPCSEEEEGDNIGDHVNTDNAVVKRKEKSTVDQQASEEGLAVDADMDPSIKKPCSEEEEGDNIGDHENTDNAVVEMKEKSTVDQQATEEGLAVDADKDRSTKKPCSEEEEGDNIGDHVNTDDAVVEMKEKSTVDQQASDEGLAVDADKDRSTEKPCSEEEEGDNIAAHTQLKKEYRVRLVSILDKQLEIFGCGTHNTTEREGEEADGNASENAHDTNTPTIGNMTKDTDPKIFFKIRRESNPKQRPILPRQKMTTKKAKVQRGEKKVKNAVRPDNDVPSSLQITPSTINVAGTIPFGSPINPLLPLCNVPAPMTQLNTSAVPTKDIGVSNAAPSGHPAPQLPNLLQPTQLQNIHLPQVLISPVGGSLLPVSNFPAPLSQIVSSVQPAGQIMMPTTQTFVLPNQRLPNMSQQSSSVAGPVAITPSGTSVPPAGQIMIPTAQTCVLPTQQLPNLSRQSIKSETSPVAITSCVASVPTAGQIVMPPTQTFVLPTQQLPNLAQQSIKSEASPVAMASSMTSCVTSVPTAGQIVMPPTQTFVLPTQQSQNLAQQLSKPNASPIVLAFSKSQSKLSSGIDATTCTNDLIDFTSREVQTDIMSGYFGKDDFIQCGEVRPDDGMHIKMEHDYCMENQKHVLPGNNNQSNTGTAKRTPAVDPASSGQTTSSKTPVAHHYVQCSACHRKPFYPIQLKCQHIFCSYCLIGKLGNIRRKPKCPDCQLVIDVHAVSVVAGHSDGVISYKCKYSSRGCTQICEGNETRKSHEAACKRKPRRKSKQSADSNTSARSSNERKGSVFITQKIRYHKTFQKRHSLRQTSVATSHKSRLKVLYEVIEEFCKNRMEDKFDVLFYMLKDFFLQSNQNERAQQVHKCWNNQMKRLTVDDCLVWRIDNLLSKALYQRTWDFFERKAGNVLVSPNTLFRRELSYLPNTQRFWIQNTNDEVLLDHLAVEPPKEHCRPKDVKELEPNEIKPADSLIATAVFWSYPAAIAKTLQELDPAIEVGLMLNDFTVDKNTILRATVRDRMEETKDIYHRQRAEQLPYKDVVRLEFDIVKIEFVSKDKTSTMIYSNDSSQSIRSSRPLLVAYGNRQTTAMNAPMLNPILEERNLLKGNYLRVNMSEMVSKKYQIQFSSITNNSFFDDSKLVGGRREERNKTIRYMCRNLARSHPDGRLRDLLWIQWLNTSPRLQALDSHDRRSRFNYPQRRKAAEAARDARENETRSSESFVVDDKEMRGEFFEIDEM